MSRAFARVGVKAIAATNDFWKTFLLETSATDDDNDSLSAEASLETALGCDFTVVNASVKEMARRKMKLICRKVDITSEQLILFVVFSLHWCCNFVFVGFINSDGVIVGNKHSC